MDYYGDNLASITLFKINTPQALVKATVAWGWGGGFKVPPLPPPHHFTITQVKMLSPSYY